MPAWISACRNAAAEPRPTDPAPAASYEDALAELERLVARMEGGQLPLDRCSTATGAAPNCSRFCRSRLEAVEQQVKVLEDGQLKPWVEAHEARASSTPGRGASSTRVEAALERWVPADAPAGLGEAMRYGVLDGGKRLRPLLVLAAGAGGAAASARRRCARPARSN